MSEILGYGVDNEGFFTSDFNEAAGLPKDYKINAKDAIYSISYYYEVEIQFFPPIFKEVNLAQTYANVFTIFPDKNKSEDAVLNGANLVSFISNNSLKGLLEGESTVLGKILGYNKNVSKKDIKDFNDFMNANQIQTPPDVISGDNSWDMNADGLYLTIYLKSSQSYNLGSDITKLAQSLRDEYKELVNSNISLDEFKEKYLDFKQRHDAFVALYKEALNGAEISIDKDNNGNIDLIFVKDLDDLRQENLKKQESSFTPIQAQSKNKETYTSRDDINKSFFLSFIENEREKGNDVLELLQNLFKVDKNKVDLKA